MGRNVSGVEAEIKELERELALPGKVVEVEDFDEVTILQLSCTIWYVLAHFLFF